MVNRGAPKSGSLCPWGPNQKARPLCPARQSLESELRNPRGLWRLAGAASNLTAVRPSGPESSAACFPNAQERGGPHSFLKPHLLVQIIGPFFFRNLKARFAIPKLNGIRVPHWPRWSGSLRSATWAGCALRPRGGRNAGGVDARRTSRGQSGSGTRSESKSTSSCHLRGFVCSRQTSEPLQVGSPPSLSRRDVVACAQRRHRGASAQPPGSPTGVLRAAALGSRGPRGPAPGLLEAGLGSGRSGCAALPEPGARQNGSTTSAAKGQPQRCPGRRCPRGSPAALRGARPDHPAEKGATAPGVPTATRVPGSRRGSPPRGPPAPATRVCPCRPITARVAPYL